LQKVVSLFYFYKMSTDKLKDYLNQKLVDLKKGKDMNDVLYKGKLSFGVDPKVYGHLPSWDSLLKNKKTLVRTFWIGSFGLSILIVSLTTKLWDHLQENWWKAIILLIATSIVVTLLNVIWFSFSLFTQVRQTEREVRKLIYEDILQKIEEDKKPEPIMN
jgi:hypothetical protein